MHRQNVLACTVALSRFRTPGSARGEGSQGQVRAAGLDLTKSSRTITKEPASQGKLKYGVAVLLAGAEARA
jgi:hypothetical protein